SNSSSESLIADFVIAFDDEWKKGQARPITSIEDYLKKVVQTTRTNLFAALLSVELHYRRRAGDLPAIDEYLSSFAEFASIVNRVYFENWLPKRFRVEKILGRGGFGTVYLAYDENLGRRVAIKVPRAEQASDEVRNEAQIAAKLTHNHI